MSANKAATVRSGSFNQQSKKNTRFIPDINSQFKCKLGLQQ